MKRIYNLERYGNFEFSYADIKSKTLHTYSCFYMLADLLMIDILNVRCINVMRGRKSSGRTARVTRVPKVQRQFLIAVVMIWQTHWSWQSPLPFGSCLAVVYGREPTRKSCFLRFRETLRIDDMATMRLMNESTLDSTHARSGSISLFQSFPGFFSASLHISLRDANCVPSREKREFFQGDWSDGFCFPRILKCWNYTIRRSNLIENEGATLIYDRSTLTQIFVRAMYW